MNLSTEIVRELLDYNPETGVFTWRMRSREWFTRDQDWTVWNNRFAGRASGYVNKNAYGYPTLLINVLYKVHIAARLAFAWMGEPLPEQVDHLDGDSLNQAWANLKPSTNAENGKNQSMRRTNTSGVCGVFWHKRAGKWQANVRRNGKYRYLGLFDDINEAAAVVSDFRAANGFTARHGQSLSKYQQDAN